VNQGKSSLSLTLRTIQLNWYVQELGGGVMIVEPKVFGRLFLPPPVSDYDDLEFVPRG